MDMITESKKNHVWRKVVWHTDPEQFPLGPYHHIEIYCCEEANGYAIWYVRKLAKDDQRGLAGVESGDYLLDYFPKTGRNDAIERAVLLANSAGTPEQIIKSLDTLAKTSKRV
ncbi:MAG: hypothetical protein HYS18_07225 [Burkholderiales bacterium]|nr:hypothetical protein [Burkholderiales bacterium]